VIASAFYGENGHWREGLAFMFHGSRKDLGPSPAWTMRGGQALGGFGSTVRAAGDVNREGYGDVAIGHTFYSGSITQQGRAWIYYGSSNGLSGSINWRPPGKRYGIEIMDLPIPVPNRFWTAVLVAAGLALLAWLAFWLRRRRGRRALALQAVREAERRRLARDLHDRLGGELAVAGQPAARLSERVTELVWLTKPANDTLPSVADFLSSYAAERLAAVGLRAELDFPLDLPPRAVPGEFRREILLAFQEALANAIKHADPSEVCIRLALTGDTLELSIADNGRGFDPVTVAPRAGHGNGLENLRSRLRDLGGTCEITSTPGQGTRVQFRAKLPA
jgi:signal transduction histidine kinase